MYKKLPAFHLVVDTLENQRRVHLLPCIGGTVCKRAPVLEMEVRISVNLIVVFIIRLYIALNELMGRKKIQSSINCRDKCRPILATELYVQWLVAVS